MKIKEMQTILYKFCSQFDEDYTAQENDYLLYTESNHWCNIYFCKYGSHYTFESPVYEVEVSYTEPTDVKMTISGDADILFEKLTNSFSLLTDNVKNQIEWNDSLNLN